MQGINILSSLYHNHNDLLLVATVQHPFIVGCTDASVTVEEFNTWLLQDFLYVKEFLKYLGRLESVALSQHQPLLRNVIIAVEAELAWFRKRAQERGISEDVLEGTQPKDTTQRYIQKMREIVPSEACYQSSRSLYFYQVSSLYFIEDVYCRAWRFALEQAPTGLYAVFAQQWGNDDFFQYVQQLKEAAAEAITLALNSGQEKSEVESLLAKLLQEILKIEIDFWDMARPRV